MKPLPIESENIIEVLRAVRPYVYLATPYSKYPGGIEAAFMEACRCSGWLIENCVKVYCPIAHTHPIAVACGLDPLDHAIWLPADEPFMEGAGAICTAMMPTWQDSYGIGKEIEKFQADHKPTYFVRWPRE